MTEHDDSCDDVVGREPCPSCVENGGDNSGDNLARYADGHAHCFACGHHENGDSEGSVAGKGSSEKAPRPSFEPIPYTVRPIRSRRISERTCQFFSYGIGEDFNGDVIHVADVRTDNGSLVAQKIRTKDKDFWTNGSLKEKPLIGMHLWSGGKRLIITEGEIDMLSYGELTNCKYPVVSLPNGSKSAKKAIVANMKWLQRFEEVILMFDMDDAGEAAVSDVLPTFRPGHAKVASLPKKDVNDCLKADMGDAVINAVFRAEVRRPSQIVTIQDIYEKCLIEPEMGLSFPWPSATEATLGIRRGEIHIVGAAPKIGKTEHQHQLIKHMTEVHGEKPGVMSLEENPVKTTKKVAGKYMNRQFTKPKAVAGWTTEELVQGLEMIDGKIEFYSSEGVRDYEEILNTVRYWAASGMWFFILDPLTALVAEHDSSTANDILNDFMSKAASMAMELNITFFMYSHVNPAKTGTPHDQGGEVLSSQFTGSRAMEKWAHYGWGISRNRNEEDEIKRNTAKVRLLFDREFGEFCEYYAFYNHETNDWSEVPAPGDDHGFDNEEDIEL